ncbi:LysR family transcriptional regulator [Simiduia agarivorans]|uniref:LysR family transcriptional regulator n=1 Tax=Simiduia agarivorans (strain DSM 21679 / JCM 13881 / BCRC 17597 / SA1) TaxID=1117647 RepID=K4KTP5_SIMAS|nr:LysR family transcriptional regulator [Simiduia agarivorans]AFU97347.1 LysR family transcriptional regulator [Simiduia agarivorans SA1 = DSM 21679]
MDTQNLAAFCAVADCGSFSEAAGRLFITQPAISKRIANLENQLDCRLFDRIGRSVELTAEGQLLLPNARHILQTLADSRQALIDLKGGVGGQLRLACSHHIGLHRLPALLKGYRQTYPEVDIQVSFLDSEAAYDDIRHGRHDLALVTLSTDPGQDLVTERWWPDPMVFMCANHHPLAHRKNILAQDLVTYPALLPDPYSETTRLILQAFNQQGLEPGIANTTKSLDALRMLAEAGLGWTVLPNRLKTDQLTALKVTSFNAPLHRDLGCIRHKDRSLNNAARAFLTLANKMPEREPGL